MRAPVRNPLVGLQALPVTPGKSGVPRLDPSSVAGYCGGRTAMVHASSSAIPRQAYSAIAADRLRRLDVCPPTPRLRGYARGVRQSVELEVVKRLVGGTAAA